MSAIFAVVAQKGGVAKTTSVVNLAAAAAGHGWRALVVDCDPQFDATRALGWAPSKAPGTMLEVLAGQVALEEAVVPDAVAGVDLLAGNRKLRDLEITLAPQVERERFLSRALDGHLEAYDLVLIDCPPNLGLLTVNAIYASRRLIVPVSMRDKASLQSLGEVQATLSMLAERGVGVEIAAVIRTLANPRRMAYASIAAGLEQFDLPMARCEVPERAAVANSIVVDRPVVAWRPDDASSLAYAELARELFGVREREALGAVS